MEEIFKCSLPLPPSKNGRLGFNKKVGRFYTTVNVKDYYDLASQILNYKYHIGRYFIKSGKIIIWCNWFLKNGRQDCHNFHDCLADAFEKATGINDSNYLLRDLDKQVDKDNPRVEIEMFYDN